VPKTSNIEAWSKVTPWGENALFLLTQSISVNSFSSFSLLL